MENLTHKKILYIITKSNWGGAQAYVYTLARHFAGTGAKVVVALGGTGAANASAGLLADKLESEKISTVFLSSFARDISIFREAKAFFELLRVIRAERPEVLHLNSSKAGGLGALAGRIAGVRNIVFTSHGLAYDEDRSLLPRTLIWLSTWITILLTHTTIVISEDNLVRARRLPFCSKKVRLVHNGIDSYTLLDRDSARAHLLPHSQRDGKVWIGTIAELTRNKALPYLVRAAAQLKKKGCSFELSIIGVGEEQEILEGLISTEGVSDCVHLLGFVANAGTYLSAFDIFTLVSVKEGLPYVLLEAAHAKCVVVGTRIPGITDIIDETTGVLVEPKNVEEIVVALETLLSSQEKRMELGEAVRRKVSEKFSVEKMFEKIASIYN